MAVQVTLEKIPNRNRSSMNMEVSKLFVDATFPESSRLAALDMLGEIRVQFNKTLQQKGWMDEQTREKVSSARNHAAVSPLTVSSWIIASSAPIQCWMIPG
jgi:predicted metalloendopeptidase